MKFSIKWFIILFVFTVFVGCTKSSDVPPPPAKAPRTVLAYMAANNSLSGNSIDNINSILAGVTSANLNGGNYIVYLHDAYENPKLIQIIVDKKGKSGTKIIKEYPDGQNSASAEVLQSVINDVCLLFPADDYGLILWSHGSGWLPSTTPNRYSTIGDTDRVALSEPHYTEADKGLMRIQQFAFGQSGSNWLELSDLVTAIPDDRFSFLIFDACMMANVEVAYALRKKADYIIASSAEIIADGMPYQYITGDLFGSTANLEGICTKFYDFYKSRSGMAQTATISLTKTSELQALADITRTIFTGRKADIQTMNIRNVQQFGRPGVYNLIFFDFTDFITKLGSDKLTEFKAQMDKTVVFKLNTPMYMSYPINTFSGLTSYIPAITYPTLNADYDKLEWTKYVYQ